MGKPVSIDLKKFYTNVLKNNPLFYDHQFIIKFEGSKDDLPEAFKSMPENPLSFTYYVKSSKVPKVDIKDVTVNFLSQDFVVPGGVQYDGQWNVKLMITNSLHHYLALRNWHKIFADISKNGGGNKTIPNVKAHVTLLDSTMQEELHDFILEGVFPTKVPDLPMAYENASNIPELDISFTYQYMYRLDEGDPLGNEIKK